MERNICSTNKLILPCCLVALLPCWPQRNIGAASASVGGGSGLDFTSFLKLLTLVATCSLSKTSTFSQLYGTVEVRSTLLRSALLYSTVHYCTPLFSILYLALLYSSRANPYYSTVLCSSSVHC